MLKKMNNKGFTVVELIASFVFTSILAITLFAAVMNYKDKQTDSIITTELLAFKSQVLIDIETDIQKRGLYSIEYADCRHEAGEKVDENDNVIEDSTVVNIPRCVDLNFNDGTTKRLFVSRKTKVDNLLNKDGTVTSLAITYAFLSYGGIQYKIPDEENIDIATDFFFEQSEVSDGLETNTPLYKIRLDLVHNDLPQNIVISFVANGSKYISTNQRPYLSFNVGDEITVDLSGQNSRRFIVIEDSSGYEDSVKAISKDPVGNAIPFRDTLISGGSNHFDGSRVADEIYNLRNATDLSKKWENVREVRLITYREVEYLASSCINSENLSLNSAPSWVTSSSYWTMSPVETDENKNMVWYVDSSSKKLLPALVNTSKALRPVIVVDKQYITRR